MDGEQEVLPHLQGLSLSAPGTSDASQSDAATAKSTAETATTNSNHEPAERSLSSAGGDVNQDASIKLLQEFDPLVASRQGTQEDVDTGPQSRNVPAADTQFPPRVSSSVPPPSPPIAAAPEPRYPGITSGFSLANIARSFSIPKARTRSIDKTQHSTASDERSRTGPSDSNSASDPSTSQMEAGAPRRSADNTNASASRQLRSEPPPFDFQLFLDQMKTRSAEPVAKYLRSYAPHSP